MATTPKGILEKVTGIKNSDPNNTLLDKSKGTVTSVAIGAGLGLLIGYTRKYNLILSVFVGGAIAGLISNYLVNKKA